MCVAFFHYLPQIPVLSHQQVSGKHNLSKSLLMITQSTDNRSEKIFLGSQREQQYTVIASKLTNKRLFNRNCVYMLNEPDVWRELPPTHGLYGTFRRTLNQYSTMMCWTWGSCFPSSEMFTVCPWPRKIRSNLCKCDAYNMNHMAFHANIYFKSPTRLRIVW